MADDRAVSTVVSYVLVVGIVAILATMLVGGFAPFVTDQQESTAQATLETFGNDLAGDIGTVDRLAGQAGDLGRFKGPGLRRKRRCYRHRGSLEKPRPIQFALLGAGRVTVHTHRHVLHEVFPVLHLIARCLRGC
jgi:hypothetical protein